MRIKSERDFWAGFACLVAGVAFAVGATHYAMGPGCAADDPCAASLRARFAQLSQAPGPGYFPLGLGVLLAIVGGLILFKALAFESEGGEPIRAFAWRPLLAIVGAIVAFGLLLEPFGLLGGVPALVCISSLARAGWRWKGVLASAAVLTLLAWLLR